MISHKGQFFTLHGVRFALSMVDGEVMLILVVSLMIIVAVCLSTFVLWSFLAFSDYFHWSPERWEHEEPLLMSPTKVAR